MNRKPIPKQVENTMNGMNKRVLATACAALLGSAVVHAAPAQYQCYDFGGLAPDANYAVGDVIDTRHATITIGQYFNNGSPATADARHAKVVSSQIAGGATPELELYLVSVRVVPKQPVQRMRTRLAQNISQTGAFANADIEVNGEKHESPAGFAGMNGRSIGRPAKGRAAITASVVPTGSGNWQNGTLELAATQGGIESFTLGGHAWRLDDMCFAL